MGSSTANFDLGAENLAALPSHRRQIADRLRAAIIAGTMEAGPVYSAPVLAAQFGVSPTPVREAMIDLAKDGLVEVLRYKGFRVTEPSEKELKDMLEVRLLLEVPTVERVASQGIAPETVARLHELAALTVQRAEDRDVLGHLAADLQFHLELLSLAGNQEIVETVRVLRSRARLYGLHSEDRYDVLLHSAQEHGELVRLAATRASGGAADLIRTHISDISRRWSKTPPSDRG
jgi:DNA-binding GntR family transcriptional regulator